MSEIKGNLALLKDIKTCIQINFAILKDIKPCIKVIKP